MKKSKKIIPIFVPHSGCPHDCIFCNQKKITGVSTQVTGNDAEEIIKTCLTTLDPEKHDIEIAFFGGSFTAIEMDVQRELLGVASKYVRKGIVKDIRLSTRPDCIDEERLMLLKSHDVTIIELGVQSMDLEVLEKSIRGHDTNCVRQSSKLIKEFGFKLGLQMMIGLVGDDSEKSLRTAVEFVDIGPDFVRIYPTLVVTNTGLERLYKEKKYEPFNLESTIEICKVLFVLFKLNNIEIIRLGLQASENIDTGKDVVAGPYHPAMGELVETRILRDFIEEVIVKKKGAQGLGIFANKKNMSKLVGNRKSNLQYFKDINLKISEKEIDEDEIEFEIKARENQKYKMKEIYEELYDIYMSNRG